MDDVRLSKYLSKILRHAPDRVGLKLEPGGWVNIGDLLAATAIDGRQITRAQLEAVVAGSDKQRFAFDPTGRKIRANQGHSVEVDLQLEPAEPPDVLYHGTGVSSVDSIRKLGLEKRSRHHVHLSADIETAVKVGSRHGKPAVFEVAACVMAYDKCVFYRSANGVWLTDYVAPVYLRQTWDFSSPTA